MSGSAKVVPRVAVRGAVLALAALALLAALYLVAATPPTPESLYPKCMHYRATGLHCPGCGTGRALHFALNGQLARAAGQNLLSVILLPAVLLISIPRLTRWVAGRPRPIRRPLPARWIWLLVAVILVFTVCRNIPAYPLSLLAPTELP